MAGDSAERRVDLEPAGDDWVGRFVAMGSPCEVLLENASRDVTLRISSEVAAEAWRIEDKFSRYLDGNVIHRINTASGRSIKVDEETARLLDFAATLYELSEGQFDVTSGVLREVWEFDGSDRIPDAATVATVLERVGWGRASWERPVLRLERGMEVDLGGIGKEYAVDRCAQLVREISRASVLINLGGDIAISDARVDGARWTIGRLSSDPSAPIGVIKLKQGALATSGDEHRYLEKNGKRYCHVLNPKTGWPVEDPPHTVSVTAPTCIEAGMLSTLALLQGSKAEEFLKAQEVPYWIN